MKKLLRILGILIVILIVFITGFIIHGKINESRYLNSESSFLLENEVTANTEQVAIDYTASLVQITIDTHIGSGLIWEKTNDEMVIISNAHLLMNGSTAKIIFPSGNTYEAKVRDLMNDYDIGFCSININDLQEEDKTKEKVVISDANDYNETDNGVKVFHVGINSKKVFDDDPYVLTYEGKISDYKFIPEFYEMMLVSEGYSQSGMSGGGIFTEDGYLLGLLSGGETLNDGSVITYAVPVWDIVK